MISYVWLKPANILKSFILSFMIIDFSFISFEGKVETKNKLIFD